MGSNCVPALRYIEAVMRAIHTVYKRI